MPLSTQPKLDITQVLDVLQIASLSPRQREDYFHYHFHDLLRLFALIPEDLHGKYPLAQLEQHLKALRNHQMAGADDAAPVLREAVRTIGTNHPKLLVQFKK